MSLVEKYRPKSFDSPYLVKTQPIQVLEERLKIERELPHLLFAGSAGTGKTTIAHIVVKKLCGLGEDDSLKGYCLDMNASDERRLEDIRGKVKDYAKSLGIFTEKRYVFLDEVDHLDWQAQPALRRIMEDYSDKCMFILSCNYPNKLIDPIKSRCSIFNFTRPTKEQIIPVVKLIAEKENIKITDDAIEEIIRQNNNDVRAVINFIDGHSANLLIEKSDISIVDKSTELVEFILGCKTIEQLKDYLLTIQFDAEQTISNMLNPINDKLFDCPEYGMIVERLCDTDYRIGKSRTDGVLQLYGFCIWLYYTIKSSEIPIGIYKETYIPKKLGTLSKDDLVTESIEEQQNKNIYPANKEVVNEIKKSIEDEHGKVDYNKYQDECENNIIGKPIKKKSAWDEII